MTETEGETPKRVAFHTDVNVLDLLPGQIVKLDGEILAEIVENMQDGLWLRVKFAKVPGNPSLEGVEDQVFATDVVAVA